LGKIIAISDENVSNTKSRSGLAGPRTEVTIG